MKSDKKQGTAMRVAGGQMIKAADEYIKRVKVDVANIKAVLKADLKASMAE